MPSSKTPKDDTIRVTYQPPVDCLAKKIEGDTVWRNAFQTAICNARKHDLEILEPVKTPEDFLKFSDKLLKIPFASDRRYVMHEMLAFHFILNQQPLGNWQSPFCQNGKPHERTTLSEWMVRFARSLGEYMDSPESVQDIEKFEEYAGPVADDFMAPPSGYFTFNQFFARHLKPGARPIAGMNNDSVIVSPADSTFQEWWRISSESKIIPERRLNVKGVEWSIHQLLEGSEYKDAFAGGIFAHSLLHPYNYHRFHAPVAGRVLEKKNIQGQCCMDVAVSEQSDGKKVLTYVTGTGFQFVQTRGLVVIDSPIGLVACIPVGMSQVSSVVLTPNVGVYLHKGEELGYFQFGGSDFVIVFQEKADVELYCKRDVQYPMGTAIGRIHGCLES